MHSFRFYLQIFSELQYLAEGKTLGEITKIRAARYRELQKTAEGRKFLEENLHKDNNISREDLTDAQLNGRVNGIIHAIETEVCILYLYIK